VTKESIIFLKSGRDLLKFNIDDIIYIEALAAFTKIYTHGKIIVVSESISDLHKKLSVNTFLRIHKMKICFLQFILQC
jgi:DNA-binding LytR/AlgR family response regulator